MGNSKVGRNSSIFLPSEVKEKLGLKPNDFVGFFYDDKKIILKKIEIKEMSE
ncbi:MAG: AbrB/MazE/SpoVT family DNA-binding domain-containing protein [Candidatus Baldrarchaeia archaeon]